jgi:hypothetical protein
MEGLEFHCLSQRSEPVYSRAASSDQGKIVLFWVPLLFFLLPTNSSKVGSDLKHILPCFLTVF